MQIDLELDLKFDKCTTRIGDVPIITVKSKALLVLQLDTYCKSPEVLSRLCWPEDTHQSELIIPDEVCKIAQIDPDAVGHTPGLLWSYKLKGTSKYKISNGPALQDIEHVKSGSRVLTIIVFRKLIPITTLSGEEFLAAWWEVVKCHHALWKGGVHHRDVSPSNLMGYRIRGQFIGVLNDYDLSSFKRYGPSGLERTGTVPFMAINLLTPEAIAGEVEHVYAHDAESFIWVLTWICLRYEDGKLFSQNRPLEEWLKLDAIRCREKKNDFRTVGFSDSRPSESHKASWGLVHKCLLGIQSLYTLDGYRKLADRLSFELLLEGPMLEHDVHLSLDTYCKSPEVLSRLCWPEDTYQNEPIVPDKVYKTTQIDPDAVGHTPGLLWSYKFKGKSKYTIRNGPALQDIQHVKSGSRVLTIIVSRNLIPITTLSGKEFLAAWWEVVKCHRALWKGGVHHRNISPSNLMGYRIRGQFIGVLNDYDLSSFQRDSPSGLERTGTVPFMAVNLLKPEAVAGKVEHVYAHDAESFIWVLTWICLRYEDGKLLSQTRPLEEWLKLDAIRCRKAKTYFWSVRCSDARPSGSHEASWDLVKRCFMGIHSLYTPIGYRKLADQSAFELLLEGPMLEHDGSLSAKQDRYTCS
ncbi:uncharacterized protein EDB93DRAFT_1091956 [Suillus bovinus]|uniref:uncharacterized protein n=1 Tax=Suillus bovinus TaxID=48563 RepID=UPI001B86A57D|nr:uncharacterized protein EDB93DRAFT_1091956 [Suillus bovinus]KAG2136115.1 hypothetical protein EDB93DRAFT_1091956 [Suillus bovinus]